GQTGSAGDPVLDLGGAQHEEVFLQADQPLPVVLRHHIQTAAVQLLYHDGVGEATRRYYGDSLVALPALDAFGQGHAEVPAAADGGAVERVVGVQHHRDHGDLAARHQPAVHERKAAGPLAPLPRLLQVVHVELLLDQRLDQVGRQLRLRGIVLILIEGPGAPAGLPLEIRQGAGGIYRLVVDRLALVDGEGGHVVEQKQVLLVVGDYYQHVGVDLGQGIAEALQMALREL